MNRILTIVFLIAMGMTAVAQTPVKLKMGDIAPKLSYAKWIKGEPITKYKDGHLYIFEFWATWCGPCIAAMPHLSELSEKYKGKATFVGVNVWEKVGAKPYETSLPNVMRFVASSENRMKYDIIADNNAMDMVNTWLRPAGIIGIPTTFVVQNGKIIWIGHPVKLDKHIDPMLNGTYDPIAYQKDLDAENKILDDQTKAMNTANNEVQAAINAQDYVKAFELIESHIKKTPWLATMLRTKRFNVMLNKFPEAEALAYAEEIGKLNPNLAIMAATTIMEREGMSPTAYQFAVDHIQGLKSPTSDLLTKLATAQVKVGKVPDAIATQEKAVELAKVEAKDPKFAGRVFDYTVTDYQKKLEAYKALLK
ncbi:TlpA family protein disulfide reductase [Pedobacter sp. PWIIR3]